MNFGEVQRTQIYSSHLHVMSLGSFKVCSDAKKRVGCRKQWEAATLVSEFAVEDLPLGRTAAMVPEFAVKDLPLDRKH